MNLIGVNLKNKNFLKILYALVYRGGRGAGPLPLEFAKLKKKYNTTIYKKN